MSDIEDVFGGSAEETKPEPDAQSKSSVVTEQTEEVIPGETEKMVTETIDEDGDVVEETTEVTRKTVKRTMKITETSATTKTTTLTTPAKLYGKDLSEYDDVDVESLLAQLSPEEITILAKEVDPDDNFLPPDQRNSYECTKEATGPLNRKQLIEHINKQAIETPDQPEFEPFVQGTVRGKKWVPPPRDAREIEAEEQIAIDMGEEYEHALNDATQEEIIDLAAILGFHSMMNQDQYHASLLNKGQPVGLGWDGITKSTQQKLFPMDPPNSTDVEESIKRVKDDDSKLIDLNLNNIKNISDEKLEQLFAALPQNEHLEVLSLTNVGLTDKTALLLAEAIEKSKTLRVLNVETNFISPPVIVKLVQALLKCHTIEEFRASNQRSAVLGNKIEMEITDLVEKNSSLLRLGLHLEFNDARHRVAAHLQRNIDRSELQQGMLASIIMTTADTTTTTTASPSSQTSSSNQTPIHPDHSAAAAKEISPTRLKSLAAFEQFIKARTWTDPADTVIHNLPSSGRLVRNLQAEASAVASTSGTGAEKKI
ncbi:tropomodulin isoform X1 [Drosophila gunungcola]|uniref:tropomodulin isoform X1 n=1 Tax=Drosophila gunungcola TaxID=103775 RepID=UPI0022E41482|nr:tropomodulin isoform X1 [Drosophila gunungcola]XP_052835776.1 tropomodulin isoform X1 [Drosophila gunungcola]XP_052835777.1 tropomodulin isoform X1 [Drosophila gunungcola]XP_052835778.1 tropomodulin isoform X1 [Drosophila gunungcola]